MRDGHWSGELIHASRTGSRINTLSRWVAERDNKGAVIRTLLESNNDITERVRVREEVRRANQDLEQFAFSATHDLQEPYAQRQDLRRTPGKAPCSDTVDEEARKFITFVHSGATRMEMLVRDLLAYTQVAKSDAPKVKPLMRTKR